jgi:hypothetical protein
MIKQGLFIVMGKSENTYFMLSILGIAPFLKVAKAIDVKGFKADNVEDFKLSEEQVKKIMENPDNYHFYELDELLHKRYDDLGLKNHAQYPYLLQKYRQMIASGTFNESQFVTKISSENQDISLATAQKLVQLLKDDTTKP